MLPVPSLFATTYPMLSERLPMKPRQALKMGFNASCGLVSNDPGKNLIVPDGREARRTFTHNLLFTKWAFIKPVIKNVNYRSEVTFTCLEMTPDKFLGNQRCIQPLI